MRLGYMSPACRCWITGPPYISPYSLAFFVLPVSLPRIHQTLKPLQPAFVTLCINAVIPPQSLRFACVPSLASIQCLSLLSAVLALPSRSRSETAHHHFSCASSHGRHCTSSPGSTVHTVTPGKSLAGLRGVPWWLVRSCHTSCTPGTCIHLFGVSHPVCVPIYVPCKMDLFSLSSRKRKERLCVVALSERGL